MQQSQDLSALERQQIDPETFRRVWARVMPDQTNSPLVVTPDSPAPQQPIPQATAQSMQNPMQPPMQKPMQQPTQTPMQRQSAPVTPPPTPGVQPSIINPLPPTPQPVHPARGDEEQLRILIEFSQAGVGAAQALARRSTAARGVFTTIAQDHRRAVRQLSTAYFLLAGRYCKVEPTTPTRSSTYVLAVREQYLWERQWAQACTQASQKMEDAALQELCRELAQDAAFHGRTIRLMLERRP